MSSIALTGKGKLNDQDLPRKEWVAMIERAGHSYTENAANADYLVASRHDTVKAINARARGATLMTYDELPGFLTGAGLQAAVAQARTTTKAPGAAIDTKEMEGNPLWGMF